MISEPVYTFRQGVVKEGVAPENGREGENRRQHPVVTLHPALAMLKTAGRVGKDRCKCDILRAGCYFSFLHRCSMVSKAKWTRCVSSKARFVNKRSNDITIRTRETSAILSTCFFFFCNGLVVNVVSMSEYHFSGHSLGA